MLGLPNPIWEFRHVQKPFQGFPDRRPEVFLYLAENFPADGSAELASEMF